VYERADRPGGLLRYGIPEFKMEKRHLDRRLAQMRAEGTEFRCGVTAGVDITADELRATYDAIVLAGGATAARDLPVPGRELDGIHQAMEYLPLANRVTEGDLAESPITAAGKNVVIIGGGDTGADCLGTALRQGAASVTQLEIMPRPPGTRPRHQPWPTYPMIYRVSSAHEEGGERVYAVSTQKFIGAAPDGHPSDPAGPGHVRGLQLVEVELSGGKFEPVPGTEKEISCELVLLAMGFTGPERGPLLDGLGVELDQRGNVARDSAYATSVPGVFAAGDMGRGQSLIVWAIAEGRSAAAAADAYLSGHTVLPAAIPPSERPLS
jgi:glutamate synthase (NADPH) small chain